MFSDYFLFFHIHIKSRMHPINQCIIYHMHIISNTYNEITGNILYDGS